VKRLAPLLAVVALVGCGGHQDQSVPPGAVALVGDRAITRAALDAELARARRAYVARGRAFPARGTPAYEQVEDAVVRLLVDRARLEVEARQAGIVVPATRIEARLRRLVQTTFGSDERRYRAQLRRTGLTEADVRAAIRTELLTAALRRRTTTPPRVAYAAGFEPSSGP
jgi:SurA N-terminal domain